MSAADLANIFGDAEEQSKKEVKKKPSKKSKKQSKKKTTKKKTQKNTKETQKKSRKKTQAPQVITVEKEVIKEVFYVPSFNEFVNFCIEKKGEKPMDSLALALENKRRPIEATVLRVLETIRAMNKK